MMCLIREVLILVCVARTIHAAAGYTRTVSYQGEIIVKCSGLQRDAIQHLMEADGVDVWHVGTGGSVDFRVKSKEFQEMKQHLPECSEEGNVEELVRKMEQEMEKKHLNKTQAEWFEEYHRYPDIVTWYKELSEEYTQITIFKPSIGKSVEGRDQPAIHITATNGDKGVRKIYFQCQIHAREWISGATCMYLAHHLVTKYGTDQRVTNILDSAEFIFIVFMNPDGYEYTWNTDRLWRKNRRQYGGSCDGVDLNRNYPYKWGESGSSNNPCSEIYHGEGPASEPEVKNSIAYFSDHFPIVGAIDWHSYSQLLLRPYGWTSADAPDEARMKEIGDKMSVVIQMVHGKLYMSQKAIGLYPTSGTARDWFYSEEANNQNEFRSAGYTVELRDTGQYGFILPPEEIIPTGEELVPAVLLFAEELNKDPISK